MKSGRSLYSRGGEILVIAVEDSTGKKIDKWKLNMDDKKSISRIFRLLEDKYGFINVERELEQKGFLDF